MDFRRKAIELYNNGMSAEKISKKINIDVTENTILGWINEEKQYEEQKIKRKNEKKIAKIGKEIKKAKQIMKNTYDQDQKEELCSYIIDKAKEILEIDPNNKITIAERIAAYMKLGQLENAEDNSKELLKIDPDNVIALNYLSKIERNRGNLEAEKEYLEKILEISSEDEEQKVVMRLARVNRILEERQKKKDEEGITTKTKMQLNEEEQQEYAENNIDIEELFTIEKQEEYINDIYRKFSEGQINSSQLKQIGQELKKYPDEVESVIFMLDLYSKMTDEYENAMEKLIEYNDAKQDITDTQRQILKKEINKYNSILQFNEEQDKKEQEEEDLRKEQTKEQREYSKLILEKIKNGKITREELPEIVSRLENYPDKARSVFLITKLYEIIEGKDEALNMLAKYTRVRNLSEYERKMISEMQIIINNKKRIENSTTEKIKRIYLKKQQAEERKEKRYERKMQKEKVIGYVEEGKSIEQIEKLLLSNGIKMTITTIRNIRDKCAKDNEKVQEKISQSMKTASDLLEAGYEPNQVYQFIGYEISLKEIKQLSKEEDIELSH